ncbi:MAG: hypothetical protein PHU25_09515 [Deltaproteobacteria bacterium]|nr:hypothetical protein [Deltaproteobacteria bacterium]
MKRRRRSSALWLGLGLAALSVALYAALYETRPGRFEDIFFYTFLDVAFIPVNVLIVGLLINGLLAMREKERKLDKLNMVIGAFFSEVGTGLLGRLARFDGSLGEVRGSLVPVAEWTARDYAAAKRLLARRDPGVDSRAGDLAELKAFLVPRRAFMLGMLQNPNLLEHETFTDLLWAATHLAEELAFRADLGGLQGPDLDHLSVDMARALSLLLAEWLDYMCHLQETYPYLFSLAVRTNPLNPEAGTLACGPPSMV